MKATFFRIQFIASVLLVAAGCEANTGEIERAWSEEVALDDGQVITIDRRVAFKGSNALGGGAYSATETSSTLSFRGDLSQIPAWDEPLMPLVLYQAESSSVWVVVAKTPSCDVWTTRGKPMPPYWEFRLEGTMWEEVPLSEESVGRTTNLLFMYNSPLPADHITLATKGALHADDRIGNTYQSIVADVGRYCGF